jgi:hypothetical protein
MTLLIVIKISITQNGSLRGTASNVNTPPENITDVNSSRWNYAYDGQKRNLVLRCNEICGAIGN